MTLQEFDMHRPILSRQLRGMIQENFNEEFDSWRVIPKYEDEIMFVADRGSPSFNSLICVSARHPMSMSEDPEDGSCGTWCFWTDMSIL